MGKGGSTGGRGGDSGRVKRGEEKWRIVGVYTEKNKMEGTLQELEKWVGTKERGVRTIVGGDFNARTGREGKEKEWRTGRRVVEREEKGKEIRKTKK